MALAFAAGIMLYISFVDILGKAVAAYADAGIEDGKAVIYGTLSFFAGTLVMLALDFSVDRLLAWDLKRALEHKNISNNNDNDFSKVVTVRASLVDSTAPDGNALNKMFEDFEHKIRAEHEQDREAPEVETEVKIVVHTSHDAKGDDEEKPKQKADDNEQGREEYRYELKHMSWAMAIAIAIHNFPEGMVTYLAYTQEPSVGIALAIGIAIHNIPEGFCVVMPLYYATGRRWYAFWWGTASGLTEPLGALLVWAVLSNGMSSVVDGTLFGVVAGMMTVISVDELLPTAHKYTSNPKHVTCFTIFGMFFIASSLMLFNV